MISKIIKKTFILFSCFMLVLFLLSEFNNHVRKNIKANAQASDSFTFTTAGDYGNNRADGSDMSKLFIGVGKEKPNFHLGLGDYMYSDTLSNIPLWCKNAKDRISQGAGIAGFGDNLPIELVSGNHDAGEGNANIMTITNSMRDCLPHKINNIIEGEQINGSSYGLEYYFDYPDKTNPIARVIMISPDLWGWNYTAGSSHYNFVKNAVLDARSTSRPNGEIPWIIVGKHKNCISNGTKPCEYGTDLFNLLMGKNLGAGGTGYGKPVDLILEGHEHSYHRSKQLSANSTTCTGFTVNTYNADCVIKSGGIFSKNGGVLAIVGTGGVALRSLTTSSDPETPYFDAWVGSNESRPSGGAGSYGFVKFTVTRTSLSGRFIATTGSYSDSFTITSSSPPATSTPTAASTATPSNSVTKTPAPTTSCPALPANTGSVTLDFSVAVAQKYKLWSRVNALDSNSNSFWLKKDSDCALNIGDANSMQFNQWTWIDYKNGDINDKALLDLAGTHSIKLIGKESGIKIDKFLLVSEYSNCIPTGITGDNCLGITPTVTNTPVTTTTPTTNLAAERKKKGDLNNDGVVNISDLSLLAANYGTTNSVADVNGDGTVNIVDLSIMSANWMQTTN